LVAVLAGDRLSRNFAEKGRADVTPGERLDLSAIVFDRTSRKLEARDFKSLLQARLMQCSHLALAPIKYLGVSRVHAAINKAIRPTSDTLILESGVRFSFPSNDYYWNRLLDANWQYEPEIDAFLRAASAVPFVFLDLGANFGYWSARVGSGLYGSHRSIAVEASASSFAILERNTRSLPQSVTVYHRAIDAVSGKKVVLYGERHAGFSLNHNWHGGSGNEVNEVETISIDDLLAAENIDASRTPVLIKLDVEGVEARALAGAARTIRGQAALIIEDAERNDVSEAVRRLHVDLGMSLFRFDRGSFREIECLDEIKGLKARQSSLQSVGLNLVAASSPVWKSVIS
jgi:FkbM family methyltransferase